MSLWRDLFNIYPMYKYDTLRCLKFHLEPLLKASEIWKHDLINILPTITRHRTHMELCEILNMCFYYGQFELLHYLLENDTIPIKAIEIEYFSDEQILIKVCHRGVSSYLTPNRLLHKVIFIVQEESGKRFCLIYTFNLKIIPFCKGPIWKTLFFNCTVRESNTVLYGSFCFQITKWLQEKETQDIVNQIYYRE